MMPDLNRRSLITGLISLVAAPAIVRAGSLMPVKLMQPIMPMAILPMPWETATREQILSEIGVLVHQWAIQANGLGYRQMFR